MTQQINLNADMGESFGKWKIGNDAELIKIIRSANVACGFHAGDATVMAETVNLALKNGASIGAHPGFNDIWGFGRRQIQMNAQDLEYMITYQIGALQALAGAIGAKVTHVKPHGALNNMAHHEEAKSGLYGEMSGLAPSSIYQRDTGKGDLQFACAGLEDHGASAAGEAHQALRGERRNELGEPDVFPGDLAPRDP